MTINNNKKIFANNLKFYMEKNNVDRYELSKICEVPYSTVSSWLQSDRYPRIDKIQQLADYFSIDKSDLIEGPTNIDSSFASTLKQLRINKKLTQEELSKEINVSTSTIGMYETSKREPNFEVLKKISNFFNISLDNLILGEKSNNSESFKDYIKNIRLSKGLSLRDVDRMSNVTFSNLSMIEHGTRKATPFILKELSKVYNVDYIELLKMCGYIDDLESKKITKNNIKNLRKSFGLSQTELGNKIGLSARSIGFYESDDRDMPTSKLKQIANFFNVTPDYILGISQYSTMPNELFNKFDFIDNDYLFTLTLKDSSMEPYFMSGDILIFEKNDNCENGQFCAVAVNGDDATFKKVTKTDTGIMLQPLNPAFETKFYTNDQIDSLPVTIIGVLKQIRRNF